MTNPKLRARVHWLSPTEGGRTALLTGDRYSTVSRFPEDTEWPRVAWSVYFAFDEPPSEQGNPSLGWVEFLSPDAPQERLSPGRSFDLYEGGKLVGSVELLSD